MGKKKVGFKKASGSKVNSLKDAVSSEDEDAIEAQLQLVLEDEIDKYNSFKEETLLKTAVKKKGKSIKKGKRGAAEGSDDEEQEIYSLGLSSSDEEDVGDEGLKGGEEDFLNDLSEDLEEDDDDDDDDDDILGERDPNAGIPDSRAWGKKARIFHNTDYVDQDFGGFEGSDAEMAELEENEAKEIKKRLTAELDESDFLGLIPKKTDKPLKDGKVQEILKVDFDSLSVSEKRKLVLRECPEVIHMLDEYKDKLKEVKVIQSLLEGTGLDSFLKEYYQSKYHSLLNYCINISYYLYLRATSPTNCKGHPVIKRILQFRRLIDELSQFNPQKYDPVVFNGSKPKSVRQKSKKLKAQTSADKMETDLETAFQTSSNIIQPAEVDYEEESGKRGITYQISKNKGLTPRRKKEQRNPRVKHREKFRKAKIRRKGQVRTARTEVQKYGGEVSGIKSNVTKSIKIK